MSLPVTPNATCDIYRIGNAPPADPDVAGVAFFLREDACGGSESSEWGTAPAWTHLALFDLAVDVRHDSTGPWIAGDTLYIPDQNGAQYSVVLVVRVGRGTAYDHKKAFLRASTPGWPTDNL